MKKTLFLLYAALFASLTGQGQDAKDPAAEKYANTITAADLSRHLHVLASDSLEGRETGEKGQKKAAAYLASQFKSFGIPPTVKTDKGTSYFQEFTLMKKEWKEVYLKISGKTKVWLEDFYAYGDLSIQQEEKMKVVFAGFGIDSPNYSDYKNLDVKGKAVVIVMGEPVKDGRYLVTNSSSPSDWANDWRKKSAVAREKGAKEVLIVVGEQEKDFKERLNVLKPHLAAPTLGFTYKQRPGSAFFIPVSMAAEIFKLSPEAFVAKRTELKAGTTPAELKVKHGKISAKVAVQETPINTENVIGFIEGTDKKDEIVVLTAHYDHLGIEGGKTYYGADDDGTGTAALIEIAEAFALAKKEGHGPRRSVLIMPVTAEEKGLLGSEYYTDKPLYPLQNTVVDLNVDMIGRLDEAHASDSNYVYLIGSDKLSSELHTLSEKANNTYTHVKLDYTFNRPDDPNRFYYRSDHYNFAKNNIPVIFYFSGVHADYHQPTDTVDKILFGKAARITRLVFLTAWEIANREDRIKVDRR